MKLTIPRKLMGCFGAMLLLTLALAYSSITTATHIQNVSNRATQQSARALELVGGINTSLANARFAQRGVILYSMAQDATEAEAQRARFQKEATGIRNGLTELRSLLADAAQARSVDDFEGLLRSYTDLAEQIGGAAVAGQPATAMEILKSKSKPIGAAMEKTAKELAAYQVAEMKLAHSEVATAVTRAKTVVVTVVLVVVCFGAAVFFVVRRISAILNSTARGLADISERVHGAADQIATGGSSLAAGASEQAAALEETSASSSELSAMTVKGTENSRAAARTVAESDLKMNQALQSLEHMVSSMQQLDASSVKVSKIIKTIDEIAFQTNILALNAAVEAARAGAAGAGFAVVADEVRSLAKRCAGAASETSELIEKSVENTRDGLMQVEQVTQAIRQIALSGAGVKILVEEVSSGSQEQAQGIEQISRAIVQMGTVTQRTAATAEESASASHEMFTQIGALKQMADDLLDMVA